MASENDQPDNEDVKKKAIVRLAVAGLVTATALAGLWWLDQGKRRPAEKTAQPFEPAPIRPAPAPEPALPEPEVAAETPVEPEPGAGAEAAPTEPPPPPRVSNVPMPARHQARQTAPVPEPHPVSAPAAAKPAPDLPPVAAGGGFVVQLGVFSNPAHAQDLVQQLRKKGIRASTETRVQVGPFLDRQEAEKAQVELRRLGYSTVLTTAAPTR